MDDTICPQCGGPVAQTGRGRPRRFCQKKCADDYFNALKPRKHGDQAGYDATRHMLTDVDLTTMTATCSQCGPRTRVYGAGPGRVGCSNRFRGQKQKPHAIRANRESSWRRRGIYITVAERDAMIQVQLGLCASCGDQLDDRLHVEHCHDSSQVRGITCPACNRAAGLLGDDPERVRRLADYLERTQVTPSPKGA